MQVFKYGIPFDQSIKLVREQQQGDFPHPLLLEKEYSEPVSSILLICHEND